MDVLRDAQKAPDGVDSDESLLNLLARQESSCTHSEDINDSMTTMSDSESEIPSSELLQGGQLRRRLAIFQSIEADHQPLKAGKSLLDNKSTVSSQKSTPQRGWEISSIDCKLDDE